MEIDAEKLTILRRDTTKISMRVNGKGEIVLCVPLSLRDEGIRAFLQKHQRWIARRMRESTLFCLDFSDGSVLTLFGIPYTIMSGAHPCVDGGALRLPKDGREKALICLLKHMARKKMTELTGAVADKYAFAFRRICITSARERWGSCSDSGTISYSFRIAFLTQDEAEYVAVHELCHTRHMNHGYDFWREVERILPDFDRLRKGIREKNAVMKWL